MFPWRPIALSLFLSIGIGLLTHPVMIAVALCVLTPLLWILDHIVFAQPAQE